MVRDITNLGRALSTVVSVCTAALYLAIAVRFQASDPAAPTPVIVLVATALLTAAAGSAAPYLSASHMCLAFVFVYAPPALYLLNFARFCLLALGALGYLAACILVQFGESRAESPDDPMVLPDRTR